MNEQETTVIAKRDGGRSFTRQPDGSFVETVPYVDMAKIEATTDAEIERQAREDGTDDVDLSSAALRVVYPDVAAE